MTLGSRKAWWLQRPGTLFRDQQIIEQAHDPGIDLVNFRQTKPAVNSFTQQEYRRMSALDTEPANGGSDIPTLGTQQKIFYRWQVRGQRKFRSHTPSEMQSALHIRHFGAVFVLGANWQSVAVY